MDRIIQFPIRRPTGEWGKAERNIRPWLVREGCSEKAIDDICLSLKSHFEELGKLVEFHYRLELPEGLTGNQKHELQESIDGHTEQLRTHLNVLAGGALRMIAILEIKLYEANHRQD